MNKVITSGIVAGVALLGMASPAFAATAATNYQSAQATSTVKAHTTAAKTVLLVGSVSQNTAGQLTVTVKTKTYTVSVGSTALIYNKAGKIIAQSDIKAGDQIRVRGKAVGTQVTATSLRDMSL